MKLTTARLKKLIREELEKVTEIQIDHEWVQQRAQQRYKAHLQMLNRLQGRSNLNKMFSDITGGRGAQIADNLQYLASAESIEIKSAAEKAKQVADHNHQQRPDDFNYKNVVAILDRIIKSA